MIVQFPKFESKDQAIAKRRRINHFFGLARAEMRRPSVCAPGAETRAAGITPSV
jgi:hypothetical protein